MREAFAASSRRRTAVTSRSTDLELRPPTLQDEAELLRAHRAARDVPAFLHYYEAGMPVRRYLEVLEARRRGLGIPPGQVPSTLLLAFVGHRIVGRVSIRHALTPALERLGGHIGYAVLPACRRRGYATAMLRQAVVIARDELGLARVLVTCDDDNVGSIRVIERNGGKLQNVVTGPDLRAPKRRYWIETAGHTRRRP